MKRNHKVMRVLALLLCVMLVTGNPGIAALAEETAGITESAVDSVAGISAEEEEPAGDGKSVYVLLGIEDQSHVHYAAPVKNMLYDALRYARQVEETASVHKACGDHKSSEEYLSGFHKEDRLLPVITLLIYWSPELWDGPLSIHDMIEFEDERVKSITADYRINLISPAAIKDFAAFQTELREVFQFIKYSNDKNKLTNIVKTDERYRSLDYHTAELLNTVTRSGLKLTTNKEEDIDVCKAIDDLREDAIKEGIEKGIEKGFEKGIKKGFEEGCEKGAYEILVKLVKKGSLSLREAAEQMGVTESMFQQRMELQKG